MAADDFLTTILSGRPAPLDQTPPPALLPPAAPVGDFSADISAGRPFAFEPVTPAHASGEDPAKIVEINRLRAKDAQDLADDDSFDPVGFITQNEALANDPDIKKKLIDVARIRHETPFSVLKFASELPSAAGHAVVALGTGAAKTAGALGRLAVNPYPTADKLKDVAELGSSVETAAVSDADLARRAIRNVFGASPKTDADFEKRLFGDAAFRQQIQSTAEGHGAALNKYFGTDAAQIVEAAGLKIDPQNVQDMSVATDLLNFLPAGAALRAAGKTFKLSEAGYQLVNAEGKVLANVAPAGTRTFKVIDAFNKVAAGAPKLLGNAVSKLGTGIKDVTGKIKNIPGAGLLGAVVAGADAHLSGGVAGVAAGIALPKIGARVGNALVEAGKSIRGEVPTGPIYRAASNLINNPATRGAAAGLGFHLPADVAEIFARKGNVVGKLADTALAAAPAAIATTAVLGSEGEKEKAAAIAGQAAIGGVFGAGAETAGRVMPFFDIAHQAVGGNPVDKNPVASPGYGSSAALDDVHAATLATLPEPVQNRLNALRELVRPKNAEIYVLPSNSFGSEVAEFYRQKAEAAGTVIPTDQLRAIADRAAGDGGQKGLFVDNLNIGGARKKVIFLNSDGSAIHHETGHLFDSLFSPEERSNLRDQAYKAYSPEEMMAFKKEYDDALRQADPQHPGLTQGQLLDEIIAETISAAIAGLPIEKLGTPKPLARSIYQKVGDFLGIDAGKTDLGLRKDIGLIGTAENLVRGKSIDDIPAIDKVAKVDLSQVNIGQRQQAKTPTDIRPAPPVDTEAANIRATRSEQNAFAGQEPAGEFRGQTDVKTDPVAEVKAAATAVDANPAYTPKQKAAFVKIGATLTQGGNTPAPLEVIYNSVKTDKFAAGRKTRKGEQDTAYAKERSAIPQSVRTLVQKVIVPNRVEVRGNEVILHAFSLDKVIENINKIVADASGKKVESLIPYEITNGTLSPDSARSLVKDVQTYTRNQANGYSGSGEKVNVPDNYFGQVPPENARYTPGKLDPVKAQFINVLLAGNYGAGAPPKTNRLSGNRPTPANVSARQLAGANNGPILEAAASKPGKNFFKDFAVSIAEFNPLRDKLFRAGVDIDNLGASNEILKLSELADVKVRNDLDFSRPNTDLIRAGFMPDPRKPVRETNEDIAGIADTYTKAAGVEYTPYTGYAKLDENLGKSIADWFDKSKHEPEAPVVKESYDALAKETKAQYDAIVAAGYKIEPFTGKGEPYSSSADMVADVRDNKHLYFLPTDRSTFGSSGADSTGNPLLRESGVRGVNDRPLLYNDLFRAVHDFFGHAKQGYEFGPRGEFNAFRAHASMFTPDAVPALAAETLAQNAWVNFGKHLRREDGSIPARGDKDFVPLQERPFADQKNTVVPGDLLGKALAGEPKTAAEQRAAVKGSFKPGDKFEDGSYKDDGREKQDWEHEGEAWKGVKPASKPASEPDFNNWVSTEEERKAYEKTDQTSHTPNGFRKGQILFTKFGTPAEFNGNLPDSKSGKSRVSISLPDGTPELVYHPDELYTEPPDGPKWGPKGSFSPHWKEFWVGKDGLEEAPNGHEAWAVSKFGDESDSNGADQNNGYHLAQSRGYLRTIVAKDKIYVGGSPKYPSWSDVPRSIKAHVEDLAFEKGLPVTFDSTEVIAKPDAPKGSFAPSSGKPLDPLDADNVISGNGSKTWMSPKGEVYNIGTFGEHETFAAKQLGKKPNHETLENVASLIRDGGWVRLVTEEGKTLVDGTPNAAQRAVLKSVALDSEFGPDVVLDRFRDGEKDRTLFKGWKRDDVRGMFLPFAAKQRLPDAVPEETLHLVHFGGSGMREVSPDNFGKSGMTSTSELAGSKRSYFYEKGKINKGDPVTDRRDIYETVVSGDKIYDGDSDPLDYASMINREKADDLLKDKGYVGIARTGGSGKRKYRQVELFEPVKVKPADRTELKGSFMADIYVGDVDESGAVRGIKSKGHLTDNKTHANQKFDAENRWRYNPRTQKVYWVSEVPSESVKESVNAWLERRGLDVVSHTAVFPPSDINYESYSESHGQDDPKGSFKPAPPVDSEAFKVFFKDSQVVDKGGKPLVMYHGTPQNFTEFKPGQYAGESKMLHFSNDESSAREFGELKTEDDPVNVLKVYLSAKNIFDPNNSTHVEAVAAKLPKADRADRVSDLKQGGFEAIDDSAEAIKEAGFDGAYVRENANTNHRDFTSNEARDIAVFDSNQVKLAEGNRGTFDASNADIRFMPGDIKTTRAEDFATSGNYNVTDGTNTVKIYRDPEDKAWYFVEDTKANRHFTELRAGWNKQEALDTAKDKLLDMAIPDDDNTPVTTESNLKHCRDRDIGMTVLDASTFAPGNRDMRLVTGKDFLTTAKKNGLENPEKALAELEKDGLLFRQGASDLFVVSDKPQPLQKDSRNEGASE